MARESRRGRGGGATARRAERSGRQVEQFSYIQRRIPLYEVLDEEALAIVEANAETILAEIGVEFNQNCFHPPLQ